MEMLSEEGPEEIKTTSDKENEDEDMVEKPR
jgi:hypothetical protein